MDDWTLLMEDSFIFFQLDGETRLKAAIIAMAVMLNGDLKNIDNGR